MRVYRRFLAAAAVQDVASGISPLVDFMARENYAGCNERPTVIDFMSDDAPVKMIYRASLAILDKPTRQEPPVGFGVALLPYFQGQGRGLHLDAPEVDHKGRKTAHWRLILCIEAPRAGGELWTAEYKDADAPLREVDLRPGDAALVRVDKEWHGVRPVIAGRRVVLSIGGSWCPEAFHERGYDVLRGRYEWEQETKASLA